MLADFNGIDMNCADVTNAYLKAKPKEKLQVRDEKEFNTNKENVVVVFRGLYGLNSTGSGWALAIRQ